MIVASRIESIPVYTHTCTLALYFPPSNTQLDHTLIVLLQNVSQGNIIHTRCIALVYELKVKLIQSNLVDDNKFLSLTD